MMLRAQYLCKLESSQITVFHQQNYLQFNTGSQENHQRKFSDSGIKQSLKCVMQVFWCTYMQPFFSPKILRANKMGHWRQNCITRAYDEFWSIYRYIIY